jgi:single-strand DNA-binding protein
MTEVVADRMQMLGSRSGGSAPSMPEGEGVAPASGKPAASGQKGGGFDDMEDDIPF